MRGRVTARRWPPDPLRVVLATALLLIVGAITLVTLANPVMDLEEAELAAAAAAARAQARASNAPDVASPPTVVPEPATGKRTPHTKKGQLLQKQLEERRARLALASNDKPERPKVSLRAGGADAAAVERVLKRKLAATFVDDASASYALTLRVDRKAGPGVSLRCSIAVAAMPGKTLVASFSSQAAVEGEVADAELFGDAADACAGALAEDLGPWLRRPR